MAVGFLDPAAFSLVFKADAAFRLLADTQLARAGHASAGPHRDGVGQCVRKTHRRCTHRSPRFRGATKALVTTSDGQFTFSIPHLGEYRLVISRIGYAVSGTKPFLFSSALTSRVSVSLPSNPITLDTVTVVAKEIETRLTYLVDAGFYRRRQEGFGHFLTRADIDKRDPLILSDLLKGMSGVRHLHERPALCGHDASSKHDVL